MRLPPSVVALIESHLIPQAIPKKSKQSLTALAKSLKPIAPNVNPATSTTTTTSRPKNVSTRTSVHSALQRYPQSPQVALGAAHRLLDEQQSRPSTSSRITNLIKRQEIYERVIRTFAQYPSSARVTISSMYQRMIDESVPPNANILKIVLGTALKVGTPIIPILRQLVGQEGLPEKMDTHLLLLIIKGLVKEVDISPKDLEKVIDDCLSAGNVVVRTVEFDEILVESYGKQSDLKGIIDILSRHKLDVSHSISSRSPQLSLYLKAMSQWTGNPNLRRKRRGSLFPRALAKDLIVMYGSTANLPLVWLNTWMNGERIAGNLKEALTVWKVITQSPHITPDSTTYSTYIRLIKTLPLEEGRSRLRPVLKVIFSEEAALINIDILEHALGAAFAQKDLPLVLLLARQLDSSRDQHQSPKLPPSARIIDIIAAGIVRSHRSFTLSPRGNHMTTEEWNAITRLVRLEMTGRRRSGSDVSLPLSTPRGGLVPGDGDGDLGKGEYVGQFKPRSGGQYRASLIQPLLAILERVVVEEYRELEEAPYEHRLEHEDMVKLATRGVYAEVLSRSDL